jgi:inositol 3-alpha-galactosyltransferase
VILTPSRQNGDNVRALLTSTSKADQEKIASWMFPDQDLLADMFRGKWVSIPWIYNAIKTMRYWHGNFYRDEEVRNLHYIIDKPWQRRPDRNSDEERKTTGLVYKVSPGEFEGIKDETLGLPAKDADAVTHGWWWEEYDAMVQKMDNEGYTGLSYLEKLVAQ